MSCGEGSRIAIVREPAAQYNREASTALMLQENH